MNVIKIVVDELPEMCEHCSYGATNKQGDNICVSDHNNIRPIDYFDDNRPDWCPLQLEEVCEWSGEYGGYDKHGDMLFFARKTGCSDSHIQKVEVPNNIFCPNCGKRIKYVEVE